MTNRSSLVIYKFVLELIKIMRYRDRSKILGNDSINYLEFRCTKINLFKMCNKKRILHLQKKKINKFVHYRKLLKWYIQI